MIDIYIPDIAWRFSNYREGGREGEREEIEKERKKNHNKTLRQSTHPTNTHMYICTDVCK